MVQNSWNQLESFIFEWADVIKGNESSGKVTVSLAPLAHQYISQMPPVLRDAVFGNIGTLVSFRVGATDAAFLEHELTPRATAADLVGPPQPRGLYQAHPGRGPDRALLHDNDSPAPAGQELAGNYPASLSGALRPPS